MDPEALLNWISFSLESGDIPEAAMAMETLEEWFNQGGFSPGPEAQARFVRALLDTFARLHS